MESIGHAMDRWGIGLVMAAAVVWYLRRMTVKTLPDLVDAFRAELAAERQERKESVLGLQKALGGKVNAVSKKVSRAEDRLFREARQANDSLLWIMQGPCVRPPLPPRRPEDDHPADESPPPGT